MEATVRTMWSIEVTFRDWETMIMDGDFGSG